MVRSEKMVAGMERTLEEIRGRFAKAYSGAVADVLDGHGLKQQVLPAGILPLSRGMRLAGPAFPGFGVSSDELVEDSMRQQLAVLEKVRPGEICVLGCGGDSRCAQWGEIMSRTMLQQGSTGAVLDGGVRDTEFILNLNFPVFARYQSPASSVGRWKIEDWHCAVTIGSVQIAPGDWILGDVDGVVVTPASLVEDVLRDVEEKMRLEALMREELGRGTRITEVYERYKSV